MPFRGRLDGHPVVPAIVDSLRKSLPYHEAEDLEYNGAYVRYGDRLVVLDAIAWAHVEEPLQRDSRSEYRVRQFERGDRRCFFVESSGRGGGVSPVIREYIR